MFLYSITGLRINSALKKVILNCAEFTPVLSAELIQIATELPRIPELIVEPASEITSSILGQFRGFWPQG